MESVLKYLSRNFIWLPIAFLLIPLLVIFIWGVSLLVVSDEQWKKIIETVGIVLD